MARQVTETQAGEGAQTAGAPVTTLAAAAGRFWSKVDKSGGIDACWLWTASLRTTGYGQFNVRPRSLSAHRVAYELTHGPIPEGSHVLHSCDVRTCCNPAHLRLGTNAENIADKLSRDRQPRGKSHGRPGLVVGQRHGMSIYSDALVRQAKAMRAAGVSSDDVSRDLGINRKYLREIVKGRRRAQDAEGSA